MTEPIEFDPSRARTYRKRSEILAFESKDAISFHKSWGLQEMPPGAWVAVALDETGTPTGEVYGIDDEAFQETYAPSLSGQPHRYMKTATIQAYTPGHEFAVRTELDDASQPGKKKVETERAVGSETAMLVKNPGGEVYPIEREEFDRMYVEVITPRRATNRDEHLDPRTGPKRILAVDGGGVRNILSLGVLESIERALQKRHNDSELRLCDYFDLMAGTSTGAVIAALLATGRSVTETIDWFRSLAPSIFGRLWTPPLFRPKHDPGPLCTALKEVFSDAQLGDETLLTGLLVVTKRLDARGVWPLSNNPRDPYWLTDGDSGRTGHAEYLLTEVLHASAAAPYPLAPEEIRLLNSHSKAADVGTFINAGASTHNNPALQSLLVAARSDNGLGWSTGAENLLLVSVGAGTSPGQHELRGMSVKPAVHSLHTTLNEASEQVETMMQWLSDSDTSRVIDPTIGSLQGEYLAGQPLISYARYDVRLDTTWLKDELDVTFDESALQRMRPLDARDDAVEVLLNLGRKLGHDRVKGEHFPAEFDLPES